MANKTRVGQEARTLEIEHVRRHLNRCPATPISPLYPAKTDLKPIVSLFTKEIRTLVAEWAYIYKPGALKYLVNMNLFVANLSPETNADGLKTLFSEFGPVVSSKVIYDPSTGASRGFGFVEIEDKFQSYAAIDNLDCSFFEGNIISVKEAKQNNTKGGSGGNRSFNRGGGGNRPQRPGGSNPRFANNAPRPGGFRSNNNYGNSGGGGYNRDSNSGGYNRENNYNRDNSSGGYNRDNHYNRDNSAGGYNRDNRGGYNSGGSSYNNNKDDDKDFNKL